MTNDSLLQGLRKKPIIAGALERLASELPDTLKYHVASHTDDVLSEAISFAVKDGLSERDIELIAVSAAYHDLGFIECARENESLGADFARIAMQNSGDYTPEEISLVYNMIVDTQVKFTENGPKQISTVPLSKYLLDADVSNLGREDFFEKAELVRQEVQMEDKIAFLKGLVIFMQAQEWYTSAARSLRQARKDENLKILQHALENNILPI